MKSLLLLTLVLATCWASDPFSDDVPPRSIPEVSGNYRLPADVRPTEYKINLEPIFESSNENTSFTFNGSSEITLEVLNNTNIIKFHAKELNFSKITLKYENQSFEIDINKIDTKDPLERNFVTLTLEKNLTLTKNLKLFLNYYGKLNDELRGFYRSSYENKEGKKVWLATTHFEPVGARQAFPCWDEPHLKAKFEITITVPPSLENYKAISNTPVKKYGKNGITIFETTPKMSTYLVAFVVSDFKALQNKKKNFRVLAKPTIEDSMKKFAYDYGLKTLEELKTFTDIDYYGKEQINKMDQIAIPDFVAGAMENWGLVTYREPRLLYIEDKTTTEDKQAIATVIAHEFSHQWFGNLVTCKWWDYIWLNEGFATFFQYYISDKAILNWNKDERSWRLMEQFVIKNVQASSFVVDATNKTRPLNPKNSVQTPAQIRSLFDDIAYKKGASILHMMYGFLSEDVFRKGLKQYLNDFKGDSVDSDDFLESVQKSHDKNLTEYLPEVVRADGIIKNVPTLKDVMNNWINEPGYPVITVTWNETLPGIVNIMQERFFLVKPVKEDKTEWYIPINYVTEDSPTDKKSLWMIPGTRTLLNIKMNNTKWILFNKDQTGYYRVNYDELNWKHLVRYLKSSNYANISAINRAQLIDDALNLARAGYLAYNISLQITSYLSKETDYIPWYAAARAFNYLDSVLLGGKNYAAYHKYVAETIKTFAKIIYTDTNDTHVDKLARVLALNMACKYELEDCENFVNKKLTEWLNEKKNLRSGILCAGLRKADAATWEKTLGKYNETKDKDEKADILAGLGCASKEIVQTFLQLILEKDFIIDIFAAMNSICAGNAEAFDILIKFINNNMEKIRKADKEDNSLLIALLNKLSNKVVTSEQYIELLLLVHGQLTETNKVEGLTVAMNNLAWIKTHRQDVENWITANCEVCQNSKSEPDSASSIALTSFLLIISLLLTRFY